MIAAFSSLKIRNFRYLWLGHLGSAMAMHADVVARSWLTWELTQSTLSVAFVNLIRAVPMLALGLMGGVIADRFDKRRVLLIMQTWTLVIYTLMAAVVLSGIVELWHVYTYSFLIGLGFAMNQPVRTAFMPQMVDKAHLLNAFSLHSVATNATRLIGPAAIGFIIAIMGGVGTAYAISAGFYAIVIWTTVMIKSETPPREDQGATLMGQFVEGFRFIIENRLIFALVILGIAPLAFGRSYITMLPAYVVDILNKGPETVGAILSLAAIGSVTGGLFIASRDNIRFKGRLMLGASMVYGSMVMIFGFVQGLIVLIPIVIMIGASQVSFRASNSSLLLELSPERLRGRVMSVTLLDTAFGSVVTILGGIISDYAGVTMGLFLMGVICLGIAVFISIYYPAVRRA